MSSIGIAIDIDAKQPPHESAATSALFVLPMGSVQQAGPVAAWATTAGWSLGAEELLGKAWVISDAGVFTPRQAAAKIVNPKGAPETPRERRWRQWLPEPPVTLVKDVRQAYRARTSGLGAGSGPWDNTLVRFVWQRHSLFRTDGKALSKALGVPLVLSVHAMQVEEAASWGVARPGWSSLTKHFGEVRQLRAADLIVCVSEGVAESVARQGIADSRILVTPNGVDATHFRPREDRAAIRDDLGLEDAFVVGWCGSFRRFHGLDLALEAMALLRDSDPQAVLLLIGDGQDRARLERRVGEMNLTNVRFTGTVSHDAMPGYLSACDAGLVLSPPRGPFHYSPVKLREYMACGLPVIAHAVGELKTSLTDGKDAMVIPPDDVGELVGAIQHLVGDSELRVRLSERGTDLAASRWSWSAQVARVIEALQSRA